MEEGEFVKLFTTSLTGYYRDNALEASFHEITNGILHGSAGTQPLPQVSRDIVSPDVIDLISPEIEAPEQPRCEPSVEPPLGDITLPSAIEPELPFDQVSVVSSIPTLRTDTFAETPSFDFLFMYFLVRCFMDLMMKHYELNSF